MSKSSKTSPRKFVEKIALLNRKESESNAAFERIIKEVGATTAQKTPLTINQSHLIPGATRQQRRRSSTGLKRSLSCRISPRERSLSSFNIQPVAQFMVASQGRSAARSNWQLAGTGPISSQPHYSDYIRTNSMHRVDAYHNEYQYNHHHHQPPTTYDDDPMEQPYSLPASGVPDINIFHVEDQRRASHYADRDESEELYIQQVIEQPSSYTEPLHMMDTYVGDYQQQPQQKYNRLTSSLNQPHALCNSRSLPDMSNLGFGSSANTPYGSSYGDESSPIANYETYSCADYKPYCTTGALDQQHQSSSQPYGQTDPLIAQSQQQQQQQQQQDSFYQTQEEKWRRQASSGPRLVWNQVECATEIRVQPNADHEARGNSEKCNFYQSQEDDWLRQSKYQPRVTTGQLSTNQQPQQPRQNHPQQRQQHQQHLDPVNHNYHEVLTKSVSSNALYEQANNWNDLGDRYCDGYANQVSHCDSRSQNRLSRSHYSDLHLVGQSSHSGAYWNSRGNAC